MNSFPTRNAVDLFRFLLNWLEVSRPSRYDVIHWRRRRRESSFLAVIVEDCVILSQKCVLNHNLDTEEVWQDGERGSNYRRECFPEILVRNFELLLLVSHNTVIGGMREQTSAALAISSSDLARAAFSRSVRLSFFDW